MVVRPAVFAVVLTLVLVGAGSARPTMGSHAGASFPHVTVFGDSIAEAVVEYDPARSILTSGFDVLLEVAPCRRVGQSSCPINGVRPPNVIDLVNELGPKLGVTVVVAVGYNDFEDQYQNNILQAVSLMERAGVQRIFWLTLHVGHHGYIAMNDAIVRAAASYKSLIPVDWNVYSQGHPEWFQRDGIHLNESGSIAMATLIHNTLQNVLRQPLGKPKRVLRIATSRLPDATRGKRYGAKLAATGGRPPYFWALPRRLPAGLRLRTGGWVGGVPVARPGTFPIVVRVRDAAREAATRRFLLRIRR